MPSRDIVSQGRVGQMAPLRPNSSQLILTKSFSRYSMVAFKTRRSPERKGQSTGALACRALQSFQALLRHS
eukprot:6436762-Pyramimonas_sp.AAC.1